MDLMELEKELSSLRLEKEEVEEQLGKAGQELVDTMARLEGATEEQHRLVEEYTQYRIVKENEVATLQEKIERLTEEDLKKEEALQDSIRVIDELEQQEKEKDQFIIEVQE